VPPPASASTIPGETPAASFRLYTVRSGDTLGAIARQFGTSVAAIEAANGIADPRRIQIGQVLRIPG
jgi:LysM repeat protein